MEKSISIVKFILASIGGLMVSILGGWDSMLQLYIMLFGCDLLVGCLKGIKAGNFSSSIMFWGFVNKIIALVAVAITVRLDSVFDIAIKFRFFTLIWFCICEGASLMENIAILGVPIPDGLRGILVQVRKGFSINISKIVKQIIENYNIPLEEENKDE